MQVGELFVVLGVDMKEYERGLNHAESRAKNFQRELSTLLRVSLHIQFQEALFSLRDALTQAASSVFEFYKNTEQASIAFEVLLGSAGKANAFIRDLKAFAATTPFEFEDVEQAAKQFLAFGFSVRDIIPLLTAVGNAWAMAGGGKDNLEGIVRALGQIKTKGRAQAEELLQLAERGVNAYRILREELGLTGEQVTNIGELNVDADTAITAIVRRINQDLNGLMNRLADTTAGMISNIKDSFKILGTEMLAGLFDSMKNGLRRLRDYLAEMVQTMQQGGLKAVVERFVPPEMRQQIVTIIGAIKSFTSALGRLWAAIKPIVSLAFKMLISALAAVLPLLAQVTQAIAWLAEMAMKAKPLIAALVGAIIGLKVASLMAAAVSRLTLAIRGLSIAEAVALAVNKLRTAILGLNAAVARTPLGVLFAIIGALVGVALSSEAASAWLGQVYEKLARLMGIDYELPGPPTQELEDYNDTTEDTADNIKDIGKEADKSKKKVEKFIAAFDEVYQVPEKTEDALGGIGGQIPIPDLNLPKPPMPPSGGGAGGGGIGDLPTPVAPGPGAPPAPPAFSFETVLAEARNAALAMAEAFGLARERIRQALEEIPLVIAGLVPSLTAALAPVPVLVADALSPVPVLVAELVPGIQTALAPIPAVFQTVWQSVVLAAQQAALAVQQAWASVPSLVLPSLAGLAPALAPVWASVVQQAQGAVAAVAAVWGTLPAMIGSAVLPIVSIVASAWSGIVAVAQSIVGGVLGVWNGFVSAVQAPIRAVVDFAREHWKGIVVTAGVIVTGILGTFTGLPGGIVGIFVTLITRVGPVLARFGPLAMQAVQWIVSHFLQLGARLLPIFQRIPELLRSIGPRLVQAAQGLVTGMVNSFQSIIARVQGIFDRVVQIARNAWERVTTMFSNIGSRIADIGLSAWGAVKRGASNVINTFTGGGRLVTVPGMAAGGIATKPQIVGIAEKGPEAVIPLERLHDFLGGGRGGGEVTVNIGVLVGDDRSLTELERRLARVRQNERMRGAGDRL